MRPYEVVIILDSSLEDAVVQGAVERATKLLSDRGAQVGAVDRWGKRRFAYELAHRWEGYYVLVEVSAEPAAMAELDRTLSLADEVIRHKVIRLPREGAGRQRRPSAPAPESEAGAPTASTTDAIGA